MFHFWAKMGQKSWAKQATTASIFLIPGTYLGVHCYGHKVIRNLLIAQDDQDNAQISDGLQSIIISVTDEIKDVFNQSILPKMLSESRFEEQVKPIKWFPSCTLMPVTFGTTFSNKGVLIGLPNYLNYDKVEDLPENMFFVKKVRLFKEKSQQDETDRPDSSALNSAEKQTDKVQLLRRSDPDVKKYAEALILSEKAKKFVIARELFISDTPRVLSIASIMLISGVISVMVSRLGVNYFKLLDAHVSQRMAVYSVGAFAGIMNYNFVSDSSNREYSLEADKKAATLNAEYMEGAKEFFEKTLERNKTLRYLVEDFKNVYDEKGNLRQPIIRFKHVPVDERLRKVRREQMVEPQTKVQE